MTHELLTLKGFRTGGLESPTSIRNSFAFDLTRVNLCDRLVVSADLHVRQEPGSPATATLRLSDPADRLAYGECVHVPASDGFIRVPLTADAITDLQQATGGFFSIDAAAEDAGGAPQLLASTAAHYTLVLAVAEAAHVAAAA
jgi:hypothetical protein